MRMSRAAAPMLLLLVGAAVGACSSTSGAATATRTPEPVATEAPPPAQSGAPASTDGDTGKRSYGAAPSAATPGPAGPAVSIGDTSLGKVVVDGEGMTLYVFTPDGGGKSVCNDACATSWPPLAATAAPTLGPGLEAADFTEITRDDGTRQVAFHGMPLYLFAGDMAAGDVTGQGLGDTWYVVRADGSLVK